MKYALSQHEVWGKYHRIIIWLEAFARVDGFQMRKDMLNQDVIVVIKRTGTPSYKLFDVKLQPCG
jgi:hypothetical protein